MSAVEFAILLMSGVAALTNILQLVVQWYTLREVGDLDHDRRDWFEHGPWRHYEEWDEKVSETPVRRDS